MLRCLLVVLSICFAQPASAATKLRVLLDWFVNPVHAPIIVAQQAGYFAREGLDVEIIVPSSVDDAAKLLIAKQADVSLSYQPHLMMQQDEGVPLVRIGTLIGTPLTCLMVKDGGPIARLEDLKGKKVGYSISGLEQALLSTMLQRHGLTLADVELINLNFSLSPALASGQVDAVIGAYRTFEPIQLALQGVQARCYEVEDEGVPPYDEMIYITHKDFVARPEMRQFLTAVSKAATWLRANPEAGFDAFKSFAPELDDEVNRRSWAVTVPLLAADVTTLDQGRYDRVAAYLAAQGLIKKVAPVSDYGVDLRKLPGGSQ